MKSADAGDILDRKVIEAHTCLARFLIVVAASCRPAYQVIPKSEVRPRIGMRIPKGESSLDLRQAYSWREMEKNLLAVIYQILVFMDQQKHVCTLE